MPKICKSSPQNLMLSRMKIKFCNISHHHNVEDVVWKLIMIVRYVVKTLRILIITFCDSCGYWVHYDYVDITADLYTAMSRSSGNSCTYWCCKAYRSPDFPKRFLFLQSLQHRQDKLEPWFTNLSQKVDTLPSFIDENIYSVHGALKDEIVLGVLEAKKRENKVVISGLHKALSVW